MPDRLPDFAHQWMEQWKSAARELPKIRKAELQQMDQSRALDAMALLDATGAPEVDRAEENPYENSLVIIQRWMIRQKILECESRDRD